MEFGSIEEGRDEDAKRRRIHHVVGFGDVEEYVAAQRVGRAYERLHGLCVIQVEIIDRLAQLFSEDRDISKLLLEIFNTARRSAAHAIAHARLRTSLVPLRPAPSCPSLREHTSRYTSSRAGPTASHTAV